MPGQRTVLEWLLEVLSVAALAGMFVCLAANWAEIPDRVPSHFSAAGEPNAWRSKSILWLLPAVGAGIFALISVAGRLPSLWNLPPGVDRNAPEVQRTMRRMLAVVKMTVTTAFSYITWTGVRVALGRASGLGRGFLPVMLLVTIVPVVYYAWKLLQFRR